MIYFCKKTEQTDEHSYCCWIFLLCTYEIVRHPTCVTMHTQHFGLENPLTDHVYNLSPIKISENKLIILIWNCRRFLGKERG